MSAISILADNIKHLRMRDPNMTQQKFAKQLSEKYRVAITRDSYARYELGKVNVPMDVLVALSRFYNISTDLLLTVDLRKYNLEEMLNLPDNRILLPIKTDSLGENKIEIIPYKASMGYLSGYADPEYIESLQTMSLPFLHNGKFRAFPVEGDSMPPYQDGTFIIGEYVESIADLKVGKTHLLVTRTGFTFKEIVRINRNSITVKSNNLFYDNYDIPFIDLWEAWQYAGSFSRQEQRPDLFNKNLENMLQQVMNELKGIKSKLP